MPTFVRDRNYKEGKFLIVVIGVDDEVCNFQDKDGRRNKCEKKKPRSGGCLEKNVSITLEKTVGIFTRLGGCFPVGVLYLAFALICSLASGWFFKLDIESQELKMNKILQRKRKRTASSHP